MRSRAPPVRSVGHRVKVIDLLRPPLRGGKTVLTTEFMHVIESVHRGASVFAGVGEGHELWHDTQAAGMMANSLLVFGEMNESPGVRCRVALSALTYAEHLRDAARCCC